METRTIVMMVLTIGTIWGGLIYLLIRLFREQRDQRNKGTGAEKRGEPRP